MAALVMPLSGIKRATVGTLSVLVRHRNSTPTGTQRQRSNALTTDGEELTVLNKRPKKMTRQQKQQRKCVSNFVTLVLRDRPAVWAIPLACEEPMKQPRLGSGFPYF